MSAVHDYVDGICWNFMSSASNDFLRCIYFLVWCAWKNNSIQFLTCHRICIIIYAAFFYSVVTLMMPQKNFVWCQFVCNFLTHTFFFFCHSTDIWNICIHLSANAKVWAHRLSYKQLLMAIDVRDVERVMDSLSRKCNNSYKS